MGPGPLRKALISLAKKGVVRFAKIAGGGGGTRPAMPKHLEFPENRENNREFSQIPAVSAVSAGFWRPFALQFQGSADDSLFCMKQRICFAGTGNSSAGARNCRTQVPICLLFQILTPNFSLELHAITYTTKLRIRRVCYVVFSIRHRRVISCIVAEGTQSATNVGGCMLVGEIKSQIGSIWNDFWAGGLSNPLAVMEQITYLLFIKRLDEPSAASSIAAMRS
jgi:hypothetical protein